MSIATYRYTDHDGTELVGECQVHENSRGFYVTSLTGPQGQSKTYCPVIYWKPVRVAIQDLLMGRTLISYKISK